MRHAVTRTLSVCAIVLAAGCASSGVTKTPPGYKQPTLSSGGTHPDLRFPPTGTNALSVTIEVMVDAAGNPDMKTLKLSGNGAEGNSGALEYWLSQVTFKPATVNGLPVAGPFKMMIQAKRTVSRMR